MSLESVRSNPGRWTVVAISSVALLGVIVALRASESKAAPTSAQPEPIQPATVKTIAPAEPIAPRALRVQLKPALNKGKDLGVQRGVMCNGPTPNCQAADQMGHGMGGVVGVPSDINAGMVAADDFVVAGPAMVSFACWRGFYFDFNSFTDCGFPVPPPNNFTITYYNNDGGVPGSIAAGPFPVVANVSNTGFQVNTEFGPATEYEYTAVHPPVSFNPTSCYWIEIVNSLPPGPCVWLWETSGDGDQFSLHGELSGYSLDDLRDFDLAWCLDTALGSPAGCTGPPASPVPMLGDPRPQTAFDLNGTGSGLGRSPTIDHLGRVSDSPVSGVIEVLNHGDVVSSPSDDAISTAAGEIPRTTDEEEVPGTPDETVPPTDTPAEEEKGCDPPIKQPSAELTAVINAISPVKVGGGARGASTTLYNALDVGLGVGWNYATAVLIEDPVAGDFKLLNRDSSVTVFRPDGMGGWTPSGGSSWELTVTPPCATVVDRSGVTLHFDQITPAVPLPGIPYLLTSIVDRNNRTITYSYSSGQCVQIADQFGHQISLTHYGDGHIQTMTDSLGRQLAFEYIGSDLTAIILPNLDRIEYTYDADHQITSKKVPNGGTYDVVTAPNSRTLLDPVGTQVLSVSNPSWQVNESQSLLTGELTYVPATSSVNDGNNENWSFEYDSLGHITRIVNPNLDDILLSFDPIARRIATITNQNGHTTTYEYDSLGRLTRTTDAALNVTTLEYDPNFSQVTRRVDPDLHEWLYEYDASGNLTKVIDPLIELPTDLVTTYEYDVIGNLTRSVDRSGTAREYIYSNGLPVTRVVDPGGLNITRNYDYDAVGRLTLEIDPLGTSTTYEYDFMNRLTRVVDDAGGLDNTRTFAYDGHGRLTQATDARGTVSRVEYDDQDRLFRETRDFGGLNVITEYSYDGNGNRTGILDAAGGITTYEYDSVSRLTRIVDPELNETTFEYDPVGNQTRGVDGDGRAIDFAYDPLNRLTQTTIDPGGLNLVTTREYATGGCGCGTPGGSLVHKTTDPDGRVTYQYFDALDRLERAVQKVNDTADNGGDADDAVTLVEYDAIGSVTLVRRENAPDPDELVTFAYDAIGRQTTMTHDPGGLNLVRSFDYDDLGRITLQGDLNSNQVEYEYDTLGRLTRLSDSLGDAVRAEFDANGNQTRAEDATSNGFTYQYDALNRHTLQIDGRGSVSSFEYDALGRLTLSTDRKGRDTVFEFDGIGRLTAEINAISAPDPITTYVYDARGNVLTRTDFNGGVTEYEYDLAGRVTLEDYPDSGERRYSYAGADRPVERIDANGDTTVLVYNDLGKLAQREFITTSGSPAVATPTDTFVYDRLGNLRSSDNANADLDYEYDVMSRITRIVQDGRNVDFNYAFTASGSTRTVTYPGGRVATENRDVRNRVASHADNLAGTIQTYLYDAAGRLTLRDNPANDTQTTYALDGNAWITRITHANGGGNFADLEYGRDNEGNPTYVRKHHDLDNSELYAYDALDRLVRFQRGTLNGTNDGIITAGTLAGAVQDQQFTNLDRLGNWREQSITIDNQTQDEQRLVNAASAYTAIANRPQGYDANGNLILDGAPGDGDADGDIDLVDWSMMTECVTGPVSPGNYPQPDCVRFDFDLDLDVDLADMGRFEAAFTGGGALAAGATRYAYDVEGRLVRVEDSSGVVAEYAFDAIGRRIERNVGGTVTRFIYDESRRVIEERDGADAVTATYTHGRWIDEVLTMDRGGQRYYYHRDAIGSVVALTDAAGAVFEHYAYDAYGNPTMTDSGGSPLADSAAGNPYLFQSRRYDDESGLYFFRSRSQSPTSGRFLTRDVAGYVDGDNLYQFVRSRPTAAVDPLGFACTGQACVSLEKDLLSFSKSGSIGPVSWSASINIKAEGEVCVKCCPECTPRACQWITDISLKLTIRGSASASGSSYGGSVGPFSFWAGIRISASASATGTAELKTDRCNNREPCADLCINATGRLSISGGASISLETWWDTYTLGADITGTGTVNLDKCATCCPSSGCRWKAGTLTITGSIDINVDALIISGSWNIWSGSKSWTV